MAGTAGGNGSAGRALYEQVEALLSPLTTLEYYRKRLPADADDALAQTVAAFRDLSPEERERFQAALSADQRALFGVFGHRAATLSVRQGDADLLELGLIASGIANYVIPPKRDVAYALAVFYHCAQQLEIDPRALFERAAAFASGEMAQEMEAFGQRTDVTLKKFGWREIRTPDGVRYTFEWR